jgi:hypothetical protein
MSEPADIRARTAGRKRAYGYTALPFEPAPALPGFWLPKALHERLITADTPWREVRFAGGRDISAEATDAEAGGPGGSLTGRQIGSLPGRQIGGVTARWPVLGEAEWTELMAGLRAARERAPRGPEYWARLETALSVVARRLADPADPARIALLQAIPEYTGYSRGMVAAALTAPDLWNVGQMVAALRYQPDKVCSRRWCRIPDLPGRVRLFPDKPLDKAAGWTPVAWEMPLCRSETRPAAVVGYAGGDVPGDTLLMIVLALSATLRGEAPLPPPEPPPAVLVRNSLEEPLLTPLVLAAIEEVDPELVSMVAALVWDHDDDHLQQRLLGQADLVIAAAGNEVVAGVARQIRSLRSRPRFHAHPPKTGFSVIGRETLAFEAAVEDRLWATDTGPAIIDVVTLLAALDSTYWDQRAGLSPRVHFVEKSGPADDLPAEYARRLTKRMRQVAAVIPRGAWPSHKLQDPFDRYKAIEGSDRWGTGLRVLSEFKDPFVVLLDERNSDAWGVDAGGFASIVDECQTRMIVVRPVNDIMEVPWNYLGMLPGDTLQSLSVAVGRPGEGLDRRFLRFADACGKRGVTSIRLVGAGALRQPAYSWDGFLPLDLAGRRPAGHFTTIEFVAPVEEMLEAYRMQVRRLAQLPALGGGPANTR